MCGMWPFTHYAGLQQNRRHIPVWIREGRGRSVGIATRLRAGRYGDHISAGGNRYFSSPEFPDRLLSVTSLLLNDYRSSFAGVSCPGQELDHSPPSCAGVKNDWSYISSHPISLYGVDKNTFTFTFVILLTLEGFVVEPTSWNISSSRSFHIRSTQCIYYDFLTWRLPVQTLLMFRLSVSEELEMKAPRTFEMCVAVYQSTLPSLQTTRTFDQRRQF
jgi:hypothetical protein